jgi:hypothetical protein
MSLMEALLESRSPSSPPVRVSTAMQFVAMMRQTAVRPPMYDGGSLAEIPQARKETEAYAAALECLKLFFNGEHFLDDRATPPQEPGDANPPTPETSPIEPAPRPLVPAGN